MTVKELIERLQQEDPHRIVVMATDGEGNGFGTLRDVEASMYRDGECGLEKLTPKLIKAGYSDEDVMKDGEKAVVLWP